jgi:hypothetical protein
VWLNHGGQREIARMRRYELTEEDWELIVGPLALGNFVDPRQNQIGMELPIAREIIPQSPAAATGQKYLRVHPPFFPGLPGTG